MNVTQNLELKLPGGNDQYSVEDFNFNTERIDSEIGKLRSEADDLDKSLSASVKDLEADLARGIAELKGDGGYLPLAGGGNIRRKGAAVPSITISSSGESSVNEQRSHFSPSELSIFAKGEDDHVKVTSGRVTVTGDGKSTVVRANGITTDTLSLKNAHDNNVGIFFIGKSANTGVAGLCFKLGPFYYRVNMVQASEEEFADLTV